MGFLLEVNDPQICYGYPRGQTGTWEWMWIGFHGNTARMILRDLVARYGGVYNLGTGHPALRRLAAFRKTGFSTTRLHAMDGMKLVLDLLLALGQTARDGIHPENDLVARALRRMAGDDAAQIKISALAQELGVTREHLTRVFSREKGMGPQEYMLRQRIEHAMQILRESNLSVKEVADGLGFSSAAAFIRAFRRVQGGTPQAFRRL
jgi:AraC-like DNA-binding protein